MLGEDGKPTPLGIDSTSVCPVACKATACPWCALASHANHLTLACVTPMDVVHGRSWSTRGSCIPEAAAAWLGMCQYPVPPPSPPCPCEGRYPDALQLIRMTQDVTKPTTSVLGYLLLGVGWGVGGGKQGMTGGLEGCGHTWARAGIPPYNGLPNARPVLIRRLP